METSSLRFRTAVELIAGMYHSTHTLQKSDKLYSIRQKTMAFAARHGRRPRILIAKTGVSDQGKEAKSKAAAFADFGVDADISPTALTPDEAAKMAVENDVHAICVLCHENESDKIILMLTDKLNNLGCPAVKLFHGSEFSASETLEYANKLMNEIN